MAHGWNGKESRWGDRTSVNIPVQMSTASVWVSVGYMKNLSLSGALVNSDIDLGLHSLIDVSIHMPEPSQRTQAVKAYVSRRTKEGIGLEWCEYAPAVVKDLLRSPSTPLPS
jgi:PilZ domain